MKGREATGLREGERLRVCIRCGEEGLASFDKERSDFPSFTASSDGRQYFKSYCWDCNRIVNAERERARWAQAKADPAMRERLRAIRRRADAKVMSDPERHTQRLENNRINAALRARARGVPEQRSKRWATVEEPKTPRLPIGPMLGFIDELLARARRDGVGDPMELVAAWLGITSRTIGRYRSGEIRSLQRWRADAMLTREGSRRLHDLWPDVS